MLVRLSGEGIAATIHVAAIEMLRRMHFRAEAAVCKYSPPNR
jgi:hypothetical protein